jgi:hypothetical protein
MTSKAYFFAFFFVVFFTFFFATFLAAFFLATFGMRSDSSYVSSGLGDSAAPQNANNMSGLRLRMQYLPSAEKSPSSPKCKKAAIYRY